MKGDIFWRRVVVSFLPSFIHIDEYPWSVIISFTATPKGSSFYYQLLTGTVVLSFLLHHSVRWKFLFAESTLLINEAVSSRWELCLQTDSNSLAVCLGPQIRRTVTHFPIAKHSPPSPRVTDFAVLLATNYLFCAHSDDSWETHHLSKMSTDGLCMTSMWIRGQMFLVKFLYLKRGKKTFARD